MANKSKPGGSKKRGPEQRRDWQPVFLAEIEKNVVIGLALKLAEVSETTFRRERQRNEEFALAYYEAHERGLDALEATLRLRATRGQPVRKKTTATRTDKEGNVETTVTETEELVISSTVGMFLLKRYRPEFRESFRIESTGPDGGPIQHEVRVQDSLEEFYAELDELAAGPPAE